MVELKQAKRFGLDFIPAEYLPPGKDEHYLRNQQNPRPQGYWRPVTAAEIVVLVKNGNLCDDWASLMVADPFDPELVKDNRFVGLVRIGRVERTVLQFHDLALPTGITRSFVIACDIGDNCAVHNVAYLAHYIVGDCAILFNLHEVQTTDHAKFGNGILKEGESEDIRVWLDLINEVGTRAVLPFAGMIPADALLWATTKDDPELQKKFVELTQGRFDARRGSYGRVGEHAVVKNSQIIKDVEIGPHCYIKGANKLKNLTILSTKDEPTQIGEGVEMVNGIVGVGCAAFYGAKAVRFVMGPHSKLKYGARLIHSYLGDNSTVSCCEMLNNLIFPAHEQHHNNSFLTASLLLGQTNLAAGVTAGSNHNSRANDGEIRAGRGFWPGLATTLKHTCRFASFCLLVKGDYPAELDIRLPFALLANDTVNDRLTVMPGFWWLYNMYALARNTWKFLSRDHRVVKTQKIEFDSLAPDTVEELFEGIALVERWTAQASLRAAGTDPASKSEAELVRLGRELLDRGDADVARLEVLGEGMENSRRKCVVLKPREGRNAYRDMIRYYAVRQLMDWLEKRPEADASAMAKFLSGARETEWVNMGGQLMTRKDQETLIDGLKTGRIASWNAVHAEYDRLWDAYDEAKKRHAYASLLALLGKESLSPADWKRELAAAADIQRFVCDQVYLTRKKDYENPFRTSTMRGQKEIDAVLGVPEKNSFVVQTKKDTDAFLKRVDELAKREK